MSETSETKGRCRQRLEEAYSGNTNFVPPYAWITADAIDRLAADVAAVTAKVDAVSPEDVAHFFESEKAWLAMVEQQRDSAIGERDKLRAEVERLKAELEQQPITASQPADKDSEDSLDGLQMLVHAWAKDRKILSNSSPQAQVVKLAEEVGELAAGVCRDDRQRILDSIGDTAVALIVMCGILRVSFRRCLQAAYDEIKERSGTIRGGVFVKVADAAPQPAAPAPGWLTDEERHILSAHLQSLREQRRAMEHGGQTLGYSANPCAIKREADVIDNLLSRAGSPPVVGVPFLPSNFYSRSEAELYRVAMDAAGVPWKEVPRE